MFDFRLALAALLLAATAHAAVKTEKLPAVAATESAFSMSARNVSAADAIAAFIKQTGISITADRGGGNPNVGGPSIVYDVEFKDLTRDDAIKELARSLSMGVTRMGSNSPPRLSTNSWSSEPERRAERMVELGYVTRNQSFPPAPNQRDGLNLQFRVWSGKVPLDGPVRINLDEATDDQGRSLLVNERGPRFSNSYDSERYVADSSVRLQFPDPPPKKIATLKGAAVLSRPKTILRLTVDGLADGAQSGDLGDASIIIGPMKRNGSSYNLPIVIGRGTLGEEAWQAMQTRVSPMRNNVIIKGPKGEPLQLQPNSWGSDGRKLTIQATVTAIDANGNPSATDDPTPPATMQWDSVAETTEELLPFTLSNIDIP